ncbi:MAG: PAS domain-containing protein [Thaumarchaeota archaeon]|nr:PAS domain-containing protein [Nitrososphaerota archaeon]
MGIDLTESLSPGHPIHTLMEEHKALLEFAHELKRISDEDVDDFILEGDNVQHIHSIAEHFKEAEKHYQREENVLFPLLEKHGITQPPKMMWSEHNQIRGLKKELYSLLGTGLDTDLDVFRGKLSTLAKSIDDLLSTHFNKENTILFPMALRTFSQSEWSDVEKQFNKIGYCCFSPETVRNTAAEETTSIEVEDASLSIPRDQMLLETGSFSKEQLEACLNAIPFDLTFIDKDDKVKYFSEGGDRVFVRTKAVIGRSVQLCHPEKSVHIVNNILDAFKTGKKNVAEFWIQMNQRTIHIRYFAVRDKAGQYLGTVEVTQDITDLKKIQGEKRLLDWHL